MTKTKTYQGQWIVFTARDGEVFRDFVAGRKDVADAIVDAAAKVEARGLAIPRDVKMSLEDAGVPFSPYRKKSKRHFTHHSRDRSHVGKGRKSK